MLDRHTCDPFRGSEAVAAGRVTRGRLQGPGFVPLFRDVFIGSAAPVDVPVLVRAVSLRAGPGGVVAGPLAALAWEADCPWEDAEAVVAGDRRMPGEAIHARSWCLRPEEIALACGVPVTTPERTAFDLARRDTPLAEAVAAVDALAHTAGFGPRALRALVDAHPGTRRLTDARRVIDLMDPGAESLPETRTRIALVLRGLAPSAIQHEVPRPGRRSYRLDMAWPEVKVAVEYDGEAHRSITRHGLDLERDAYLRALGWVVIRVTALQLSRPDALAAQVRRELAARGLAR